MTTEFFYFLAIVVSNVLRLSKTNHTPSVAFQCQLLPDISKTPCSSFVAGSTLYGDLYLSPAAINKSIETLKNVFGWQGSSISELNEPILAGKTVKLACSLDDSGKLKINFFNKPGLFKPMSANELSELCSSVDVLLNDVISKNSDSEIAEESLPF